MRKFLSAPVTRGLLLVALTLIAFAPALRGGFVYDDAFYLRDNPFLRSADGLRRLWCTTEFPEYFALSTTSFWLEWRLWGNHPLGYHATNIALHILNAILLWLLLKRLGVPGAYVAALVFALHPVTVESVAWISERKNLLSLLFALLATLAFLRWDDTRERRWHLLAVGAFALALLSKPAVVLLPVVLLLIVWWRRGRVTVRDVLPVLPFFALSLVMGLVTVWFDWHHSIGREVVRNDSIPARLAGAGWVAWFYAGKALWPANLCVIYPRWQVDAGSAVAWVPLVGFAAVCVALWKRRGAFLSVASYVALLFPVLGFIDVSFMAYSYVADHWQYMAMIPVIALVCAAGVNTAVRWQWRWWPMVAAAVIAALGIGTWRQTHVWRDEETLWRSTIARNPKAWMAHNNLGNALLKRGLPVEAAQEYAETIRLQPDYANAHYNLGIVLYQRSDIAAATGEFRETIHLKPRSAEAHNNLGAALVQLGRTNEAVAEFQTASQIAPRWEEPKDNLARLRTAH